jgi:hypothetical protein
VGSGWKENVQHAINIIKGHVDWQREKLTQENYEQLKKRGAHPGRRSDRLFLVA